MSNANEPAFPEVKTEPIYDRHRGEYSNTYSTGGLTKREYFAAMAMQGLLSRSGRGREWGAQDLAVTSVSFADALFAELERTA